MNKASLFFFYQQLLQIYEDWENTYNIIKIMLLKFLGNSSSWNMRAPYSSKRR
jgi:hypothetical protein